MSLFHYMMTLAEKGGKGLFFAFDIAVMAMPLFQSLFSFAAYLKEFGAEELEELPLVLLLIVGIPGLMICLFFQLYWKRNRYVLLFDFLYCDDRRFLHQKAWIRIFSAERI
ncbi:hypothetical protein AAG663_14285 [Bacillus licheniformis]